MNKEEEEGDGKSAWLVRNSTPSKLQVFTTSRRKSFKIEVHPDLITRTNTLIVSPNDNREPAQKERPP